MKVLIRFSQMFPVLNNSFFPEDTLTLFSSIDEMNNVSSGILGGIETPYLVFVTSIIVILGFVSIVRGCLLLSKVMDQNTPGLAMATSHLVGGIFAVNIVGLIKVIENTTGIPVLFT